MLEAILANIDLGEIIITALGGFLGWLGVTINKFIKKIEKNKIIREVIEDCVKYVEQKSKKEEIQDKYEMAKDKAVNILNSKGVDVTDDEIDLLIESFVNGLTKGDK